MILKSGRTPTVLIMVVVSFGCLFPVGCAESNAPEIDAPGIAAPEHGGRLEAVEQARQFAVHSPWRNAGSWTFRRSSVSIWDWAPERFELVRLVERAPAGIAEAEHRLRLARLGPNRNLWARQQVVEAQQIIAELIRTAPDTAGLMKAAVDANRPFDAYRIDGETEFYRTVRDFLERKWRASGPDAAEAGYRLAEIAVTSSLYSELEKQWADQQKRLEEVVMRYEKSEWAEWARFRLIGLRQQQEQYKGNDPGDDGHLQKYIRLADRHPGHPAAALALLWAAQAYGFGEYGQAQHDGVSDIERLERAMELHLRYQREHPQGAPCDISIPQHQEEPSIGTWQQDKRRGDTTRLEQLGHRYYALNPSGHTTLITALPHLKEGLSVAEYPRFYREFWDAVEERAQPAQKPAVLVARAYFFSFLTPYSNQAMRRELLEEGADVCRRLLKAYSESRYVPVVLDGLALIALERDETANALEHWERLETEFPTHPLNHVAAFDRLFVTHSPREAAAWRDALAAVRRQFPDDPILGLTTGCLGAGSLARDGMVDEAKAEYVSALKFWPAVFPAERIEVGRQTIALGSLHEVARGEFSGVGIVPSDDKADLNYLHARDPEIPKEKLTVYRELIEHFPDSPRYMSNLFTLGELQAAAGLITDARVSFDRLAREAERDPQMRLLAEIWLLRLDYRDEALTRENAVEALKAIFDDCARSTDPFRPAGRIGRDAYSLYRSAYRERWNAWKAEQFQQLAVKPTPERRFLLTGAAGVSIELYDGRKVPLVLLIPLFDKSINRPAWVTDRAWTLKALGVGQPDAAAFVHDVVASVLVMDGAKPASPVILTVPSVYREFLFFDKNRMRAELRSEPLNDFSPGREWYIRQQESWQPSDGKGWFRWER